MPGPFGPHAYPVAFNPRSFAGGYAWGRRSGRPAPAETGRRRCRRYVPHRRLLGADTSPRYVATAWPARRDLSLVDDLVTERTTHLRTLSKSPTQITAKNRSAGPDRQKQVGVDADVGQLTEGRGGRAGHVIHANREPRRSVYSMPASSSTIRALASSSAMNTTAPLSPCAVAHWRRLTSPPVMIFARTRLRSHPESLAVRGWAWLLDAHSSLAERAGAPTALPPGT